MLPLQSSAEAPLHPTVPAAGALLDPSFAIDRSRRRAVWLVECGALPMTSPIPVPGPWITMLVRDSLGDIELTPEVDIDLSNRAVRARTDPDERSQLFTLLAWKTDRFCARFRRWSLAPWEMDDVRQEAFIAFAEVIESWQPLDGNGGPAGFGYYYLRVFPLRLSDRVRRMIDRLHPLRWNPEHDIRPDPSTVDESALTEAIIAEICGRLNAADATIFTLRLADVTARDAAHLIGINRRTLHRNWPRIVSIAREVWEEREAG